MESLKRHQRLLIFLLLALAVTCVISPWVASGEEWFHETWGGADSERYPFSRIFNRTFMITSVILFFFCRRFLRIASPSQLGLGPLKKAWPDLLSGWGLALASMVALGAAMAVTDVFTPYFRLSLAESLDRCFGALMAGIFAGSMEEIFFRGILFKGLFEEGRRMRAYVLANGFYSAIHFVKPGEPYVLESFAPLAGFRHLAKTFAPFLEPATMLPGLFGLFLLGLVLSYAFARTGSLYLSIGLHAGWVFSLKTVRVFGDYRRGDLNWLFGATDPKIVSGLITWIGLILVGAAVYRLTRTRPRLGADPPHATGA